MATSFTAFNIGLYLEHLSEASFLYGQRRAQLHDPEVNWPALANLEERLEAHLDALVVGGRNALDVARARAAEGDAGELHAALRLFCRLGLMRDVFDRTAVSAAASPEASLAAADALCADIPAAAHDDLIAAFAAQPQVRATYARVMGSRRVPAAEVLLHALTGGDPGGRAECAWALGRVGSVAAIPVLRSVLQDDGALSQEAAAISLLRLGDEWPVRAAMHSGPRSWSCRVLGVAGGPESVGALVAMLADPQLAPDAALGLGLLGDLAGVMPLLDALGRDNVKLAAATALNTITGAQLHAMTFVPHVFTADELNDEERAAFERDGTVPTRQGEPFGERERQPITDAGVWQAWLGEHRARFQRGKRWRMGRLCDPAALVSTLACETTPFDVRASICDELVIRYGLEHPFEADAAIAIQRQELAALERWALSSSRFAAGEWCLGGQGRA